MPLANSLTHDRVEYNLASGNCRAARWATQLNEPMPTACGLSEPCRLGHTRSILNTAMDEMFIVYRQAAGVSDLLRALSPAACR